MFCVSGGISASAPQLVQQRLWYVVFCLCDDVAAVGFLSYYIYGLVSYI